MPKSKFTICNLVGLSYVDLFEGLYKAALVGLVFNVFTL